MCLCQWPGTTSASYELSHHELKRDAEEGSWCWDDRFGNPTFAIVCLGFWVVIAAACAFSSSAQEQPAFMCKRPPARSCEFGCTLHNAVLYWSVSIVPGSGILLVYPDFEENFELVHTEWGALWVLGLLAFLAHCPVALLGMRASCGGYGVADNGAFAEKAWLTRHATTAMVVAATLKFGFFVSWMLIFLFVFGWSLLEPPEHGFHGSFMASAFAVGSLAFDHWTLFHLHSYSVMCAGGDDPRLDVVHGSTARNAVGVVEVELHQPSVQVGHGRSPSASPAAAGSGRLVCRSSVVRWVQVGGSSVDWSVD